jgi:serine beta-lactamase-like protein LACTB
VTPRRRRLAAGRRLSVAGAVLLAAASARVGAAQSTPDPAPPSPASAASPVAASPTPPPSPAVIAGLSALPAPRAAAIEAAMLAAMGRLGIPGLSAAVVVDREPRWSAGFGVADVENGVPATPATRYRLASVAKPITATAALQLAERGLLDLEAPIQRYVPAFPARPWPVTPRQLLSHQSGIRNWTQAEFHNTRRYLALADTLAAFADDELLFEPGTRTHYSSFGFTLLGAAIEAAGGGSFLDVLRANVFRPAGMETARDDDVLAIVPGRARGYQKGQGGALINASLSDTSNRTPAGGLIASAEDVARFASALQRGVLLKPQTLRLAFTPQPLKGGGATGYGLGWVLARSAGRREVYHMGGQPQVSTMLYMVPDAGVAVAVLANLEGIGDAAMLDLARQVAGLAAR